MHELIQLSQLCAPEVDASTMARIIMVESSANPYAIGVVGAFLERQPRSKQEALSAIKWLRRNGYNFSVGIAQVNIHNFAAMGLTPESALDACHNIRAGAAILQECYARASERTNDSQRALRMAFSCYESGNFKTGFKDGYVAKILKVKFDGLPGIDLPRKQAIAAKRIPVITKAKAGDEQIAQPNTPIDAPAQALLF